MTDAQKELCEKLDAPSYTTDDYMVMAEAANEIRYLAGELLAAHNAGARDAEDAKRYRFIKSKMQVGAVQTQLPLYRTLHWIGYEDCSDVRDADAAIDAEIERGEREGEHETR